MEWTNGILPSDLEMRFTALACVPKPKEKDRGYRVAESRLVNAVPGEVLRC